MDCIFQKETEFRLKCKYHPENDIICLNVKGNICRDKTIYCSQCLKEDKAEGKFLNFHDILNCDNKQKIENWPFFQSEEVQYLFDTFQTNKQVLMKKISFQFSEFKQSFLSLIDDLQKKILSSLEDSEYDDLYQKIMSESELKQLSNIIKSNQVYEQLESSLSSFITECSVKFQQYELEISRKKDFDQKLQIEQKVQEIQNTLIQQLQDQIASINYNNTPSMKLSLMDQLKFTLTDLGNPENYEYQKEKDGMISLTVVEKIQYPQIVSNYVLDKNLKYLLRVEIIGSGYFSPMIGLIRQSERNIKLLYLEGLCFYSSFGMAKPHKGRILTNLYIKEIEIFISISDNIMMVTDYPNHENVNILLDENKKYLHLDNLQIGFSHGSPQAQHTYLIKEFCTVQDIPNW